MKNNKPQTTNLQPTFYPFTKNESSILKYSFVDFQEQLSCNLSIYQEHGLPIHKHHLRLLLSMKLHSRPKTFHVISTVESKKYFKRLVSSQRLRQRTNAHIGDIYGADTRRYAISLERNLRKEIGCFSLLDQKRELSIHQVRRSTSSGARWCKPHQNFEALLLRFFSPSEFLEDLQVQCLPSERLHMKLRQTLSTSPLKRIFKRNFRIRKYLAKF